MATYNITANNLSGAGIFNIFAVPDSSAQDFINATGIADTIQQNAICDLVRDLKNYGLWSKMKAIYPFVTDNRNLLDYTEDFSNGTFWPRGGTSITTNTTTSPNGTLTADKISEDTTNAAHYVSFQTGKMTTTSSYTMSAYLKAGERTWAGVYLYNGSSPLIAFFNLSTGTIGNVDAGATATITDAGNGWYRCTVSTILTGSSGNNGGILCASSNGTWIYTGTLGNGIYAWGAQLESGSTATTYQSIATTQQAYISSQFKFNLKDPRDLDAAYRLVFNGGWTFDKTGATPNGTNGYADTKLNPTTVLTNYNAHSSTYNRTNGNDGWEIGLTKSTPSYLNEFLLTGRIGAQSISGLYDYNGVLNGAITVSSATAIGYFNNSVTSNTSHKLYKNGAQIGINTNTNTSTPANGNIYLAAVNDIDTTAIAFSSKQTAFSSIGDGLTDIEAANLYTAVQAFQTSLSRQV
jgi:hypothetical protein